MISINTSATLAALVLIGTIVMALIGSLPWSNAGIIILCLFILSGLNAYILGVRTRKRLDRNE